MKNAVYEYIEPTDKEKEAIWKDSVFVFDTNVLLNLYRFSKNTRDALINSMKKKKKRIWIPYHVAYEFMENRCSVIFESGERYEKLREQANDFIGCCVQQLRRKDTDAEVKQLKKQIETWLTSEQDKDLLIANPLNDAILDQLLLLFEGKVGRRYSSEELKEIKDEGKTRYEKKIPPGYKDSKKQNSAEDDNNMYGDLIIWKQVMEYAKKEKCNITLVVNDTKEDWWSKPKGKTIGPRAELRKEFHERTSKQFLLYTMERFLQLCNEEDGQRVEDSVLEEVISVDKEQKRKDEKQQKDEVDLSKQITELERRIENKKTMIEILEKEAEDEEYSDFLQPKISQLYSGIETLRQRMKMLDNIL